MHSDVFVVIPAFKAPDKIASVIRNVQAQGFSNIVVVDDGSMDATYKNAKAAGATTLQHLVNRGYGAALRTGMEYAKRNNAKFVVTIDADGQQNPAEIKDLLKPLQENKADIALGSRFLTRKSNVPFWRKVFLKGGIWVTYLFYGLLLTDSHNGFRAINHKALHSMKFELDRMEHSSEYPSEIKRRRLRYVEIPVTVTYTDETMEKGQKTSNAFVILFKMILQKLLK